MAGGGYSPGFNPHLPGLRHTFLSKALGATMWFFLFYRVRKDGGKLIGKHPWEGHGHGHGHGEEEHHH
ncbi:hypothetical protein BDV98DRAFT_592862 [Pterulicium gracile]|uniref:Uncharacterized protein n=1 Tax=Pterulicium gracile TaxID=1884261 RepID=A0A5C3QI03_9AGAR|nr:hypothetical protein BDV98DRAFT_592862 [Pterula gracilis]